MQLLFTFIFGGSQFYRMLTTSQGVNLSWFLSWLIFLLLNLALTIRAHQNQPSRVTLQTILSYAAWTFVVAADLAVMLWKGSHVWGRTDTITTMLVGLGVGFDPGGWPTAWNWASSTPWSRVGWRCFSRRFPN